MSATTINLRSGNQPATHNGHSGNEKTRSAFAAMHVRILGIKAKLREVMAQLDELVSLLKMAQKEQRIDAKEIRTVRAKLREIQRLEL